VIYSCRKEDKALASTGTPSESSSNVTEIGKKRAKR
jgi:hypothetical protein